MNDRVLFSHIKKGFLLVVSRRQKASNCVREIMMKEVCEANEFHSSNNYIKQLAIFGISK